MIVNWYENVHHYIGKHCDSERQIVRDKATDAVALDLPMLDRTTSSWAARYFHEVPKVYGKSVGRRVYVTLCQFRGG